MQKDIAFEAMFLCVAPSPPVDARPCCLSFLLSLLRVSTRGDMAVYQHVDENSYHEHFRPAKAK